LLILSHHYVVMT